MEKIVLKDKTEILVEGGTTGTTFATIVAGTEGIKTLLDKLTEENLSSMELKNEAGLVCAVLENRQLGTVSINKIEKTDNWKVTVTLKEKDAITLRLEALEAGQALQDNAIADMSETVYA